MIDGYLAFATDTLYGVDEKIPELYRRQIENLQASLNDTELRTEADEILRSLITRIVLTPVDDRLEVALRQPRGDRGDRLCCRTKLEWPRLW
jgi:hypothetical protein